jgi:hypothetical protein
MIPVLLLLNDSWKPLKGSFQEDRVRGYMYISLEQEFVLKSGRTDERLTCKMSEPHGHHVCRVDELIYRLLYEILWLVPCQGCNPENMTKIILTQRIILFYIVYYVNVYGIAGQCRTNP